MEFPHLGSHCSITDCKKLDFLPVICDACEETFCSDHMSYMNHQCTAAAKKDFQVPVCPMCNEPVAMKRGAVPDVAVTYHIENYCKAAVVHGPIRSTHARRKCSVKGCKVKELIPIHCNRCSMNYCLRHRHPGDHKCRNHTSTALESAEARLNRATTNMETAGSTQDDSDDEALARALELSMKDVGPPSSDLRDSKDCIIS